MTIDKRAVQRVHTIALIVKSLREGLLNVAGKEANQIDHRIIFHPKVVTS